MSDETARLAALRDGVTALRTRRTGTPDRWLLVAGGVLVPLGVGLIVLGWYGAAQTTLDFEQTPYVLSGGILGLALTVVGALTYFGYWLTRLVRDGQATAVRDAAHQQRVEELLAGIAAGLKPAPQRTPALVVTAGGTMLHTPDCPATHGQQVRSAPARSTLPPCGLCRPRTKASA